MNDEHGIHNLIITPRILNHLTLLFLTKESDRGRVETMKRVKLENWSKFNYTQSILHVKGFQYRRHKSDNFINALMEFDNWERIQLFLSMFFHCTSFIYMYSHTEHKENVAYSWGEMLGNVDDPRWSEPFRGTEEEDCPQVIGLCLCPLFARTYVLLKDPSEEEKVFVLMSSRCNPRIQLAVYRWCLTVPSLVLRDMSIETVLNRLKTYNPTLESMFWAGYRDTRMTV